MNLVGFFSIEERLSKLIIVMPTGISKSLHIFLFKRQCKLFHDIGRFVPGLAEKASYCTPYGAFYFEIREIIFFGISVLS